MGLRELTIKISYRSKGRDNILDAFIIPAFKQTKVYKRSVGFFSSSVFELTGEGVCEFAEHGGSIQLICSPKLSKKDIEAIKLGYQMKEAVVEQAVHADLEKAFEMLEDDCLCLLAELIVEDVLNIKLIDVDDTYGIYHDKMGIFIDSVGDKVLFVGSPNESKNAYMDNYEKIRISVSWREGDIDRIEDDEDEFDSIWDGTNPFIKRKELNDAVIRKLQEEAEKRNLDLTTGKDKPIILRDYQKEAIAAWKRNNNMGFYVMATGTGKTWTAIYTAHEIIKNENILLVICAPYKHLVKQWYEDVHKVFPKLATILVSSENMSWQDQLLEALMDSAYNDEKTVIAISTIKSFDSEKFEQIARRAKMKRMLIVDEAHRFKKLSDTTRQLYSYMLGLSATPASRKNDEFAKQLLSYFGGEVYDLPIEYAIDKGYLVHYDYHPIYVEATANDEASFDYYTRLMSSCFRNNTCIDVDGLAKYKRARLRVISIAEEKISRIQWILSQIEEKDHFIVYCGDGKLHGELDDEGNALRHIQFIKNILTENGYKVCQFTATEKMDERMRIVESFNKGMIDAMVAIRCLDEGINIPSIEGALLLSSNDDYREFVQRRGRILRTYYNMYTEKKKQTANIYDVIVLPSDSSRSFALIELRRFYEYARLANNYEECMSDLDDLMLRYGINQDEFKDMEDVEADLDE